jgi:hypothetical protein
MNQIDILMLGVPRRGAEQLRRKAERVGSTSIIEEQSRDFYHLRFLAKKQMGAIARLYDAIWCEARAHWPRSGAARTLARARYVPDPSCIMPRCDRQVCKLLCGADIWRSAQYWDAHSGPVKVDCDDIELLLSGMNTDGVPLFVLPNGGNEGHVMHLAAPKSAVGIDHCIPAGMNRWRGPRECFYFDEGREVHGTITHRGNEPHIFHCEWKRN